MIYRLGMNGIATDYTVMRSSKMFVQPAKSLVGNLSRNRAVVTQ